MGLLADLQQMLNQGSFLSPEQQRQMMMELQPSATNPTSMSPEMRKKAMDLAMNIGGLGSIAGTIKNIPYASAPNNLMGFSRYGPQKAFGTGKYPVVTGVKVKWPDGTSMIEAMEGTNIPHALERARRNWPDAMIERISPDDLMNSDLELYKRLIHRLK